MSKNRTVYLADDNPDRLDQDLDRHAARTLLREHDQGPRRRAAQLPHVRPPPMNVGTKGLGGSFERGTPVTPVQGCLEPIVRRDGGAFRGALPIRKCPPP